MDLLGRWHAHELPGQPVLVASNHPDHADLVGRFGIAYHHLPVSPETRPAQEAALLDLFSPSSPIVVTVPFGQVGSCSAFVNVVPADGATHTDKSGVPVKAEGSAATFDQHEFDAAAAFVRSHDWSAVIAGIHPFAGVQATTTADGTSTMSGGPIDTDQLTTAVQATLTQNGLDTGGSAAIVTTGSCGAGTGADPGSGTGPGSGTSSGIGSGSGTGTGR